MLELTKTFKSNTNSDYYDSSIMLKCNSTWNFIIGKRSNGKTYSILKLMIDEFLDSNEHNKCVYIRRFKESLKTQHLNFLFQPLSDYIYIKSNGKYNGATYYRGVIYLEYFNEQTNIKRKSSPFCHVASLNAWENAKGVDVGYVTIALFDEMLSRERYLYDEFTILCNVLSTFFRDRHNVKIFCLSNPVSKSCPVFEKIGVSIDKLKQGNIYCYNSGDTSVLIEYCADSKNTNKIVSNVFDFNGLNTIKSGTWEINEYPHISREIVENSRELFRFYIVFSAAVLRVQFLKSTENYIYCYICSSNIQSATKNKKSIIIIQDKCDMKTENNYISDNDNNNPCLPKMVKMLKMKRVYFATDNDGDYLRIFFDKCKINPIHC